MKLVPAVILLLLSCTFFAWWSPISRSVASTRNDNQGQCQSTSDQPSSWRGLLPLKSSKLDVEKLLGPTKNVLGLNEYETENEFIHVTYAKGNCHRSDFGWKVPTDTILNITVIPRGTVLLSELGLDLSKFSKIESVHPANVFYYENLKTGLTVRTRLLRECETVTRIEYGPYMNSGVATCPPEN